MRNNYKTHVDAILDLLRRAMEEYLQSDDFDEEEKGRLNNQINSLVYQGNSKDLQLFLKVFLQNWDELFSLKIKKLRTSIFLIKDFRNKSAHYDEINQPYSEDESIQLYVTAKSFLRGIHADNFIQEMEKYNPINNQQDSNFIVKLSEELQIDFDILNQRIKDGIYEGLGHMFYEDYLTDIVDRDLAWEVQKKYLQQRDLADISREISSHGLSVDSLGESYDQELARESEDDQSNLHEIDYTMEDYDQYDDDLDLIIEEGIYPDTLFISNGITSLCYGKKKFRIISENKVMINLFALQGFINQPQKDSYLRHDVLCLPQKENAELKFGRNKAKLLVDAMDFIDYWVETGTIKE